VNDSFTAPRIVYAGRLKITPSDSLLANFEYPVTDLGCDITDGI